MWIYIIMELYYTKKHRAGAVTPARRIAAPAVWNTISAYPGWRHSSGWVRADAC